MELVGWLVGWFWFWFVGWLVGIVRYTSEPFQFLDVLVNDLCPSDRL